MFKKVITVSAVCVGVAFAGVAFAIQHNPQTFVKNRASVNADKPAEPKPAKVEEINLEPMLIVGEAPKAAPKAKVPAKSKLKAKECKSEYHVVGYKDSKFQEFRGVFVEDCR